MAEPEGVRRRRWPLVHYPRFREWDVTCEGSEDVVVPFGSDTDVVELLSELLCPLMEEPDA